MLASPSPGARRCTKLILALVIVAGVLGYRRTEQVWCSACWAQRSVRSYCVAGLRLWRCEPWTVEETSPQVARFLPTDHVHDADARGGRVSVEGVLPALVSVLGCGFRVSDRPSEFAVTLAQVPEFAEFLDARVRAGRLDVALVRRLISVPGPVRRMRGEWQPGADDAELMASGGALWDAWRGKDSEPGGFWNYCGHPAPVPRHLR